MKECLIKNMGVNCFIAFSFFVFAPLEIYLTNQSSFWFSLRPLLIYAVCMFIIVYSICTVLDFINKKCVNWFKGFAWGVSIALYIQGNFLNGNYGTLDGNPINWKSGFLMSYRIIDIVAWLIIIGLCWFIFIKRHEIAQIIGICLVVTQLITIGILIIGGIQEKSQINATTQHEFEYSADSNVIVVCADGFDSVFFERALEEKPEIYDQFDGFTYYNNVVGTSLYTDESVINLLTGNILEEDGTYKDNVSNAYDNSMIYKTLQENKYKIGIYEFNSSFLDERLSDLTENVITSKLDINSYADFGKLLYQLVSFKYMPHELKKYFWMSTTDFSMIKANDNMEYYTWDNLDFYNGIKTGMSVVDDGEKRYRFYHIQGPHSPAVIDENAKPVKKVIQMEDVGYADAQYQQALGVIKILVELVTQLKQEGIYDNSTIIFTADHGWEVRPRPLFLMKLKNSLGKMKISDIQVSMIEDYATTIEAIVNEDWEAPNAIFNLPNVDRRRPFYAYDINTKDRTYTGRNKYISTAKYPEDIGNPSSWTKEVEFEVNLNDSSRAYIEEFSPKDGYVWLDWYTIDLMIDLNGNYNNLLFGLEYEDVYHGPQIVEIYVNGNKLLEYIADKNEEKQIIIPKEYINGDHLWITLKFPEATSPQDNGEAEDARILSLGMTGMYLESTD